MLYEGGAKGGSGRWVIHTFLISFHFHSSSPSNSPFRTGAFHCSTSPTPSAFVHRPPQHQPQHQHQTGRVSSCQSPLPLCLSATLWKQPLCYLFNLNTLFSLNYSEFILLEPSMSFGFWFSQLECHHFVNIFLF